MNSFGRYGYARWQSLPFGANEFGVEGPTEDDMKNLSFPSKSTTPFSNGGIPINRRQLNLLGYLATIGSYLENIGYPFGNERITESYRIGGVQMNGYPKGAIVSVYDDTNKMVREYISLVDNNTDDLPWRIKPAENGVVQDTDENEYWRPLVSIDKYDFFPSSTGSNKDALGENRFAAWVNTGQSFECSIDYNGWVNFYRTFTRDYARVQRAIFVNGEYPTMKIIIDDGPEIAISPLEGVSASRFLPVSRNYKIKVEPWTAENIEMMIFCLRYDLMSNS